ncbi:inositol polyphosphate 5-phosphatase K-like [Myxocyprinus asiaticus]|uniref:inositol polyphosphate 5-phosphatase K-like n=1 Tax=Myxocyprinus asiaticus TaxID=70543 RepID=UPI002222DDE9|nr:inositol polyphosphate 5-phosphatase K-like [Myxocyprinus asiaticus]XP_051541547.1 inositol polyphosphate 5-phosphatase K-like [Myxocyprinus asiaticus]XP_051541548.1 inositol polyphosphate 5-phosphatase K-like [Myxocyprinus asiaticus]
MDPMEPIKSCSMSEGPTGVLGLHKPPALLGNPCNWPTSLYCQLGMTGNSLQAQALQPNPAVQERGGADSGTQAANCVSISRPRPTALGSKAAIKVSRPSETNFLSNSSTESPLPYYSPQNPQFSPTSQLSLNHPSIPPTLPSRPSQPIRVNTHNNHIARPTPNRSLPSKPIPQPIQSPETQTHNTGDTDNKLNMTISEEGDFRVHIVTWNVGSAMPPDDITSLFGPHVENGSTDMVVIGLQEVNSMINKRLKDALFTDQWSELCMDTLSRFGYVLVASQRMQGVFLLVFSKFCHLPFLRGVQTQSTRTGLGGYWGNKGGVSVRMMLFGHPVCFLNCHLPAHMRNLEQRMEDFESILQQQQFEGGAAVGVLDHDVLFWFGDLNFRIEGYDIHVVKSAIENDKLPLLWEKDQLNMAKKSESVLEGFMEGPLQFSPTYKFDVGTHTYDTSAKKRKPAWTDRILWRLRRTVSPVPSHNSALQRGLTSWLGGATKVSQQFYHSHMGFTISDHKPVSALFSLHFPFKVNLPLVTLEVEKEWTKFSDATAKLTMATSFQRSSWDWVGLYKVGFKHHKDYAVYVWAKSEHSTQVTFSEEDLPRDPGEYILGYYSNNMNSIVGVTEPFQVHLPMSTPPAPACRSHSDSSDVSSEDDSTLVLLTPSSRSPSPGKRHHHHQKRQRSRSPAVPVLSASPLPSLQSLSLCPCPRNAPSSSSQRPSANAKKESLVSPDRLTSPSLSPLRPRSPVSPGNGVSAPEALIAAILGEHRLTQIGKAGDAIL